MDHVRAGRHHRAGGRRRRQRRELLAARRWRRRRCDPPPRRAGDPGRVPRAPRGPLPATGCRAGQAVATTAGRLPARWVIHTVGPVWSASGRTAPRVLASAYRESLRSPRSWARARSRSRRLGRASTAGRWTTPPDRGRDRARAHAPPRSVRGAVRAVSAPRRTPRLAERAECSPDADLTATACTTGAGIGQEHAALVGQARGGGLSQMTVRSGAAARAAAGRHAVACTPRRSTSPGTGDAGGMNVYVVELARRLAALGIEVEVFTRATSSDLPPVVELDAGRHRAPRHRRAVRGPRQGGPAGPAVRLHVRRACAPRPTHEPGWYDLVHSPLLAVRPGRLAGRRALGRAARALDAHDGQGQEPHPGRRRRSPSRVARAIGEAQVVEAADRLVANTDEEAQPAGRAVRRRPGPGRHRPPRASTSTCFRPGDAAGARAPARPARPTPRCCCSSAGSSRSRRPTSCSRGGASCSSDDPPLRRRLRRRDRRRAVSGTGLAAARVAAAAGRPSWASPTSCASSRRSPQIVLPDWYRAADLTVVPSYSESFGLVAIESQACGTPVVAAAVGGLRDRGRRRPVRRAARRPRPGRLRRRCSASCSRDPGRRAALGRRRSAHAAQFGWSATAADDARRLRRSRPRHAGRGRSRVRSRAARSDVTRCDRPPRTRSTSGGARVRGAAPGHVRGDAARRAQAEDHRSLVVGRAQRVGQRLRRPPPGREPRGGLPLAARAQHAQCTASRSPSTSLGDIYLVGRLPLHAVTADEVDRLLGSVLEYADGSFNTILELGFADVDPQGVGVAASRAASPTAQPGGVPAPRDPDAAHRPASLPIASGRLGHGRQRATLHA